MLRRRFMMQKTSSGFKYSCKFELEYGGQTNQYMLYKTEAIPTVAVYGIGFTIICDNTLSHYMGTMYYDGFEQNSVTTDNLEIKIIKPDSSKVTYNIPLKFAYTPPIGTKTYDGIGCSFALIDGTTDYSSGIATQYTWVTSPPMSEASVLTPTSDTGIAYTRDDNRTFELVNGLQQGIYTIELIYTSNINFLESQSKLYLCNTGSIYSYTQSKSTYYNSCASLCKKQFLLTDGTFVDNMYKQDGTI